MYKINLHETPDTLRVSEDQSRIHIYAVDAIEVEPSKLSRITFNEMSYDLGNDVVGIPYLSTEAVHTLTLYHPETGCKWSKNGTAEVAFKNCTNDIVTLEVGDYLCSIYFITTQFYRLMRKHDGSDKGLRSAFIKIELDNENSLE